MRVFVYISQSLRLLLHLSFFYFLWWWWAYLPLMHIYISSLVQPHLSSLLFCNIEGYIRFLPTEIGTHRDYSKVVFSRNFRIGPNRCLNAVSHKERLFAYKTLLPISSSLYTFSQRRVAPADCKNWGLMGTHWVHSKGVLPWLVCCAQCAAGARDSCPALAALVIPVQNIFFSSPHTISLHLYHRPCS